MPFLPPNQQCQSIEGLLPCVYLTSLQVLNTDQYVIYHLKHDDVLTTPWHDNACLLVVASDRVYDGIDQRFLRYFVWGGRLLSFGSAFDSVLVDRQTRQPAGMLSASRSVASI